MGCMPTPFSLPAVWGVAWCTIMMLSFPQAQNNGPWTKIFKTELTQTFPLFKLIACGILLQSRKAD